MTDPIGEGAQFGDYRIERELARGGMGIVYIAEQTRLQRRVALKVIAPEIAGDEQFRLRFEREARHAASLEHPNVVPVFDAGEAEGHLYIAMRLVEGEDLGTVVRRDGALPQDDAIAIIEQVAAALDCAHSSGLIHRDVKPANILLAGGDPKGHAYLGDLGLTKEAGSSSHLTRTGSWIGTIDYAAPEQMEAERALDARADVYALGCVLYNALAGEAPFEGSDTQKLWAKMNKGVPALQGSDAELARAFDPVIARATAMDPGDRYPSAGDLGRATVAAARGEATTVAEHSVATGPAAAGIQQQGGGDSLHEAPTRVASESAGRAPAEPTARIDHGSSGTKRALVVGILGALVVGLAAGALLIAGIGGNGETDEPPQGPETGASSGAPSAYATYSPSEAGFDYVADLPAGEGWSDPDESRPYGTNLLRTTVRGPEGRFLLVDRTPSDLPEFGGEFDSSREVSNPNFGSATEYVFSQSEAFPDCNGSVCVDYQIEDGRGGGWGVLAGGGEADLSLAREMARRVADSITFGD